MPPSSTEWVARRGKAIDMLKEASKDPEKSKRLSQNFSRYLKVGVIEDQDNKEALLDLASFATTSSDAAEGTTLPQSRRATLAERSAGCWGSVHS